MHSCPHLHPSYRLSPQHGQRIGEAGNPGPPKESSASQDSNCLEFCITNPTSIVHKASVYKSLKAHFIACAETAATGPAQAFFTKEVRDIGCRTFWSPPVPFKGLRKDGEIPLRGKATGVAVLSHIPTRYTRSCAPCQQELACRYLKLIVDIGSLQCFVAIIYGAQHSQPGAPAWNDRLWQRIEQDISSLGMPAMVMGDFNMKPEDIQAARPLLARGFRDLPAMHLSLYGDPMPHTCKEATTPDNCLMSPEILQRLRKIQVHQDWHFDTHRVVRFCIEAPLTALYRYKWRQPNDFAQLIADPADLAKAYQEDQTQVSSIEAWSSKVERAVDLVVRRQSDREPHLFAFKNLPKSYTGLGIVPKTIQVPYVRTSPKARSGEYEPPGEPTTIRGNRMVKPCRRLHRPSRKVRLALAMDSNGSALPKALHIREACPTGRKKSRNPGQHRVSS